MPYKEEEVRWSDSYDLCADFQVRLKLAPQEFGVAYLQKKASFQSTKKKNVYQGGNPQRNLGGGNVVPMEYASLFSFHNVDTRWILE